MSTNEPLRYYAVPDPDTGDMTFWYRTAKGQRRPWPTRPQARYGPTLWTALKRDPGPHDHLVPVGLSKEESDAFARDWHVTVRRPWLAFIDEAIDKNADAAMARFAAIATRCCICGRVLTDPETKINGIGPECIRDVPDSLVHAVREQVQRIIGQADRELE